MANITVPNNSPEYIEINSVRTDSGTLTAWQSKKSDDPRWDAFLAQTPYGQFYQTSMWAQVRTLDGWQPLIIVITLDDILIGGFQVLIRSKSYIGKIGLVLKGPVVDSNDSVILDFAVDVLRKTAKANRIQAIIVQPPDRDEVMPDLMQASGFSPSHLEHDVKNNTVVIDLRGDEEEIFKAIKSKKRQNIKTAIREGVTVREGDRDDLRTFFRFMLETCNRQGVSPSPSSELFLTQMWNVFSPTGNIKIFVSEYNGEDLTCIIVIPLGDTAYLWKFGWSGNYAKLYPNVIIIWEIIKWAKANGYRYADLAAVSKSLADTLWRDEVITAELAKTYSYFKVGFGGKVVRLTEGFVYIYNPFIRWSYNTFMPYINSKPFLKKKILFPAAE